MRRAALVLVLVAGCGGSRPGAAPTGTGTGDDDEHPGVVADTRTAIERRRDAACERLGPKLTACAVEEARAAHAAGTISDAQLREDTSAALQRKHTEEFLAACQVPMSSRQVRVLEVCFETEQACGPLTACLEHLQPQ